MNIFLDTISPRGTLFTFDDARSIQKQIFFDILGKESTQLIEIFDQFLQDSSLTYQDISHIVAVAGPGSFTGVRTAILLVNTINFVIKKSLTSLTYFDLFDTYPIVKTSSKRDAFVQFTPRDTIHILPNTQIIEQCQNIPTIATDATFFEGKNIVQPDYKRIVKKISLDTLKKLDPVYIKKPNIS